MAINCCLVIIRLIGMGMINWASHLIQEPICTAFQINSLFSIQAKYF